MFSGQYNIKKFFSMVKRGDIDLHICVINSGCFVIAEDVRYFAW